MIIFVFGMLLYVTSDIAKRRQYFDLQISWASLVALESILLDAPMLIRWLEYTKDLLR